MIKFKLKPFTRKHIYIILGIVFFTFLFLFINDIKININANRLIKENKVANELLKKLKLKEQQYNECLNLPFNDEEKPEELLNKEAEIKNYLNKYKTSIYLFNPQNNYSFKYNEDKIYYAASLRKMPLALYYYLKADEGIINLDEGIKYTSDYLYENSKGTKKHQLNSYIPIRSLLKYSIRYSDNSAYIMLLNHIGINNFISYLNSLGVKYLNISNNDFFGSTNVNDSMIYIKSLDEYFQTNTHNAMELQEHFINSILNYLAYDDIKAASKYGYADSYFHLNGIVYTKNPYYISILTTEGKNETVFKNINKIMNELNENYLLIKEETCKNKVFKK
ncbi:MAG: serine hydrolase [Mollicutes bacterium]|nr:serine hydrolase [Mollicutes bacterium]